MFFYFSRRGVFVSFWRVYRFVFVMIVLIIKFLNSWLKKLFGDGLLGMLNFIFCWSLNLLILEFSSWFDYSIVLFLFESLSFLLSFLFFFILFFSFWILILDLLEFVVLFFSFELLNISWNCLGFIIEGFVIFFIRRSSE